MKRLMWLFFTAVIILGLSGCGEKETIGIPPVLTGMSMSAIQRTVCFILIRFPRIGSSAFLIMRQRSIFPCARNPTASTIPRNVRRTVCGVRR